MAKIAAGEPVKIVCWGDSVTVGGDASTPEHRYSTVFARRLKAKYPDKPIEVETIAVGGSNSRQWLWPEKYPGRDGCDWQRIVQAKPHLVTLEFVNDAGLSGATFTQVYDEIRRRVQDLDAELILITPHFTKPEMMGFKTLREPEKRPYVLALRDYATRNNLALADASARWEHLWKEGLPYVTLLRNGINHPDDRGHLLFAEELMKCFD
jgi:lysophospholipase L1-like esterase